MSADYVLTYRDQKLGVIEAKRAGIDTAEGVGQAKEYAARLQTPFAYATNGLTWYEIDMKGGERVDARPARPRRAVGPRLRRPERLARPLRRGALRDRRRQVGHPLLPAQRRLGGAWRPSPRATGASC